MTTSMVSTTSSTTTTPTTTSTTLPASITSNPPSSSEATSVATTPDTTDPTPETGSVLENWHIAVICTVGFVLVVIFVIVVCLKRRRREKHAPPSLPLVDETGREVTTPPQPLQPRPPVITADYGVEEDEPSGPTSYTYVDPAHPPHVPVFTDSLQGRGDVYENVGGDVSTGTYIVPIDRLPHHAHSDTRLEDATYMPMGPPVCRPNGPGYVNLPHNPPYSGPSLVNLPHNPPPGLHTQVSDDHYENSPSDGPAYCNVLSNSPSLAHSGPSKTPTTALSHNHSHPKPHPSNVLTHCPSLAHSGPSKTPTTALSHPHSHPKPHPSNVLTHCPSLAHTGPSKTPTTALSHPHSHPSKGGHVPKTALKPKVPSSPGKPLVSPKPKERSHTAPRTFQLAPVPLKPLSPSQDDSDSESNPGEDYINLGGEEGEGHNYVNAPDKKVQTKPRTAKRVPNGSSAPS